jgi:uncharacterized protein
LIERIFADTGYWIALFYPSDGLHLAAVEASLKYSAHQLVTSEMVLTEFLNSFSNRDSRTRRAAVTAVATLKNTSSTAVVPQTSELFEAALKKYQTVKDKNWSLTDCSTFHIMEQERLTAALTHDHHFVQAGFRALLR